MVWEAHGLGEFRGAVAAVSGVRNESYIVNGDLVARFNTLDPQFAKFRNEQIAYELLSGSGLPVPKVVLLDESRSVVPYDVIVVTRLPGVNVTESWRDLGQSQLNELMQEAGRCLAQLHGVTFSAFGKLSALDNQPFRSWPEYFNDYAQRYIVAASSKSLIDAALFSRLEAVLDDASDVLDGVTTGVLVHSDFHYENLLQTDGRLSGVLDFEWALSGDPSYDFITADWRDAVIPEFESTFQAGYVTVRGFDDLHQSRLMIYQLFFRLEDAVDHARQADRQGTEFALDAMTSLLAMAESSGR